MPKPVGHFAMLPVPATVVALHVSEKVDGGSV